MMPQQRANEMQIIIIIVTATIMTVLGETMLSVGIKHIEHEGKEGLWMLLAAIQNSYVIGGVSLMALYFGLYLLALSKAQISFVSPFTALSYLLIIALARLFLNEHVSLMRWIGVSIIVSGAILINMSRRS